MDAIILAAGLGTRLRPHTNTVPKPLLPVRGRPILDWTLAALPEKVTRVIVVVHYLGEQVQAYLEQQKHVRDFEVVWQHTPRGTGDAVRICQPQVRRGSFLVLNGDDLYGAKDLAELAQSPAGLLVKPVDNPERWGIVTVKEDGMVAELVEKPKGLTPPQLANAGAYVFPGTVFNIDLTLSPRGEYEVTEYVSVLAKTDAVKPVPCDFWFPIGDEAAWRAAEKVDLETVMKGR